MTAFIELTKSALRRKILAYFFSNPEASMYLRELARVIETDPGNLSKELGVLEKEGVFLSQRKGKEKFFCLNKSYPLYGELKSIVFKTVGVKGSLVKLVHEVPGINIAFMYGSYAKNQEDINSDIDLGLLIDRKRFNEDVFLERVKDLEKRFSREVNYIYYTSDEWSKRVKVKDSFILNILNGSKIMLLGEEDGLRGSSALKYLGAT